MSVMATTGDRQTSTHASELDWAKTSRPTIVQKPQIRVVFRDLGESITLQGMEAAVLVASLVHGSIKWDDQNDGNDNDIRNPIPDGEFNGNTKIEFCCRSDGNHNDPILLPPTQPFALYRYNGRCQKVLGMNDPIALLMHFDDEDTNNDNRCYGNRPDGPCNDMHNHDLYLC